MKKLPICTMALVAAVSFPTPRMLATAQQSVGGSAVGSPNGSIEVGRDFVIVYNAPNVTILDRTDTPVDPLRPLGSAPSKDIGAIRKLEATASGIAVTLPSDIESIWVFFQDRTNQTPDGCQRAFDQDNGTPQEFVNEIAGFIRTAEKNPNIDLVITAFSEGRQWVPVHEIRINGRPLRKMVKYWCNGRRDYGDAYVGAWAERV